MGSTALTSLLVACLLLAAGGEGACTVCAVLQLAVLCAQDLLWRQGRAVVRRGASMSALRIWRSADGGQRADGAAYISSSVADSYSLSLADSLVIEPQNG